MTPEAKKQIIKWSLNVIFPAMIGLLLGLIKGYAGDFDVAAAYCLGVLWASYWWLKD